MSELDTRYSLRAHIKAFRIPPIHDALVIGKRAPIGRVALQKALELIVAEPFTELHFEDEVVSDLLVRSALLRRLPAERLRTYVLDRVKPLMEPTEILHLDLFPEVVLEGTL
ncbi:MAG: hypothetical protein KDD82_03385 [Planctomycetes bacterium]|nr:hypothetical protein [Planctomycetota bacterium]